MRKLFAVLIVLLLSASVIAIDATTPTGSTQPSCPKGKVANPKLGSAECVDSGCEPCVPICPDGMEYRPFTDSSPKSNYNSLFPTGGVISGMAPTTTSGLLDAQDSKTGIDTGLVAPMATASLGSGDCQKPETRKPPEQSNPNKEQPKKEDPKKNDQKPKKPKPPEKCAGGGAPGAPCKEFTDICEKAVGGVGGAKNGNCGHEQCCKVLEAKKIEVKWKFSSMKCKVNFEESGTCKEKVPECVGFRCSTIQKCKSEVCEKKCNKGSPRSCDKAKNWKKPPDPENGDMLEKKRFKNCVDHCMKEIEDQCKKNLAECDKIGKAKISQYQVGCKFDTDPNAGECKHCHAIMSSNGKPECVQALSDAYPKKWTPSEVGKVVKDLLMKAMKPKQKEQLDRNQGAAANTAAQTNADQTPLGEFREGVSGIQDTLPQVAMAPGAVKSDSNNDDVEGVGGDATRTDLLAAVDSKLLRQPPGLADEGFEESSSSGARANNPDDLFQMNDASQIPEGSILQADTNVVSGNGITKELDATMVQASIIQEAGAGGTCWVEAGMSGLAIQVCEGGGVMPETHLRSGALKSELIVTDPAVVANAGSPAGAGVNRNYFSGVSSSGPTGGAITDLITGAFIKEPTGAVVQVPSGPEGDYNLAFRMNTKNGRNPQIIMLEKPRPPRKYSAVKIIPGKSGGKVTGASILQITGAPIFGGNLPPISFPRLIEEVSAGVMILDYPTFTILNYPRQTIADWPPLLDGLSGERVHLQNQILYPTVEKFDSPDIKVRYFDGGTTRPDDQSVNIGKISNREVVIAPNANIRIDMDAPIGYITAVTEGNDIIRGSSNMALTYNLNSQTRYEYMLLGRLDYSYKVKDGLVMNRLGKYIQSQFPLDRSTLTQKQIHILEQV